MQTKSLLLPSPTNNILATLQQLRSRGQFIEAKSKAITYLKDKPDDIDVQLQLGLIYYDLREFAQAENSLQLVLQKAPNYLDARIGLIKVKIAKKEYSEAEALIQKGLIESPHNQALLSTQALIHQAQASFQKNNLRNNTLAEVQALRKKGQLEAAEAKAIEHLKIYPKDVDVKLVLGSIYLQQKQTAKAETTFKAILEQVPTYTDARLSLIKIKLSEKKYEEANALLQQGLKLAPENKQLTSEAMLIANAQKEIAGKEHRETSNAILAELKQLRSTGPDEIAKNKALHYLKSHPEDVDVIIILAGIYFAEKNFTEAENLYIQVLLKVPTYVDARVGLIKIKIAEQNFKTAENLIREGEKLNPHDAQLNTVKDLLVKAEKDAEKTQQLVANTNISPLALMHELRSKGQLQLAIEKGVTYLKKQNDVDVSVLVGLIYFQLKNYRKAESFLRQALKQVPTYLDARIGLIKIYIIQYKYQAAMDLIKVGLTKSSRNRQLLVQKRNILYLLSSKKAKILSPTERALAEARMALTQKNYSKAKQIFCLLLLENPNNVEARIGLADYHLELYNDFTALAVVQAGRKLNPTNPQLLLKEGEIQFLMRQYPVAADYYKEALRLPGQQEAVKKHLAEINQITPNYTYGVNEIWGILR